MNKLPKIEPLDEDHLTINGYLVDMVAINQWLHSRIWPAHSPHGAVRALGLTVKRFFDHPAYRRQDIAILQHQLARLTFDGLYIPNDPFEVSCTLPWFRLVGNEIALPLLVFPRDLVQISLVWYSQGWQQGEYYEQAFSNRCR